MFTCEIESSLYGKKIRFNLLDNDDFTIPHVADIIPNLPGGSQLPTQAKQNVCIIAINLEETITSQGALYEINSHKNLHENTKSRSVYE